MTRTPLALTVLLVADLPRAAAFYDAALGWAKTVDVPVYVEYRVNDGARLGLMVQGNMRQFVGDDLGARRPVDGSLRAEVYLHVDDLEAAIARLEAAGAPCVGPRAARGWGDEAAYFLDPDGYVVVVAAPLER
ncbi:MAG: VOC family protein [Planctomycetes bacterium]|nr:VOC family protein [Planctomycetota bacterium]